MWRIEFELPGLPKGMNGSHGHWRVAAKARKTWREASAIAAMAARLRNPHAPLVRCRIICTRYSTRPSDFDNLVASFKPIIDGLIDAKIIVNDDHGCILERQYLNAPAKAKQGKIKIEVEEA